jgi:hypothetical protein
VWGCVSLCVAQPGRAIGTGEIVTGIIMSAADQAPSEVVWSLVSRVPCEIGVARGPPVDEIANMRM